MRNSRNYAGDGLAAVGLPVGAFEAAPAKINSNTIPRHQPSPETKIYVKSNFEPRRDAGQIVAFTERNENHPSGEAFIAGEKPTLIALTEAATEALNSGQILTCSDDEVRVFQAEKIGRARKYIATQKELARQKYIQVIGSDNNFEAAWNESARAKTALQAVEEIL